MSLMKETLSDLVSYALGYQHLASDNVQVRKSNGDEKPILEHPFRIRFWR